MAVPQPNDVQVWLRTALEQNWSIRAASAAVAVTEKEVSVQRAGYYPSMALRASTGRNETGGSLFGGGSTVGDTRVTLNLSVPIFQSGYTYGMSHAAASRLGAASSNSAWRAARCSASVLLVPEHRHRHGPHQGAGQLGAVVRAGAQAEGRRLQRPA